MTADLHVPVTLSWHPYVGVAMIAVAILVIILYVEIAERRHRSCDGCRVESLGSCWPYIEHTCSKSRARYRDRKGRLFVFGRYVGRVTSGE